MVFGSSPSSWTGAVLGAVVVVRPGYGWDLQGKVPVNAETVTNAIFSYAYCDDFTDASGSPWQDLLGYSCSELVEEEWCNPDGTSWHDGEWDNKNFANGGYVASQACCGCGGGVKRCWDHSYADGSGLSCDVYGYLEWCTTGGVAGVGWQQEWGTFPEVTGTANGLTAVSACCACGGGLTTGKAHSSTPHQTAVSLTRATQVPNRALPTSTTAPTALPTRHPPAWWPATGQPEASTSAELERGAGTPTVSESPDSSQTASRKKQYRGWVLLILGIASAVAIIVLVISKRRDLQNNLRFVDAPQLSDCYLHLNIFVCVQITVLLSHLARMTTGLHMNDANLTALPPMLIAQGPKGWVRACGQRCATL